ncbi:hypothetical protein RIR_jg12041.t1 [Rhizophagus irregularis DAOM 181602=DAOM 197198]|nr:hypothetical protein RIR_jg12041.t1 [Rhizophagus irregularis DAOM 181602=DAOM 197198]
MILRSINYRNYEILIKNPDKKLRVKRIIGLLRITPVNISNLIKFDLTLYLHETIERIETKEYLLLGNFLILDCRISLKRDHFQSNNFPSAMSTKNHNNKLWIDGYDAPYCPY